MSFIRFVTFRKMENTIKPLVVIVFNLICFERFIRNRCLSLEVFVLFRTNIYRVYKVAMTTRVFVSCGSVESRDKIACSKKCQSCQGLSTISCRECGFNLGQRLFLPLLGTIPKTHSSIDGGFTVNAATRDKRTPVDLLCNEYLEWKTKLMSTKHYGICIETLFLLGLPTLIV